MQLWWFIALGARFWLSYLIFRMVSSLVLSEYPSLWEELAKYFDPSLSFLTSGSHYTNARKDFNIWKNEDLLHSVPSTGCGLRRCRGGCLWCSVPLAHIPACLSSPICSPAGWHCSPKTCSRTGVWSGPVLSADSSVPCQDSLLQPAQWAWY